MEKIKRGSLVIPRGAYPEEYELVTVQYLLAMGKNVTFIAPIRAKGVRTPDIFMDGSYWEVKSPVRNGRWAIEKILKSAVSKSENIVLDVGRISADAQKVYSVAAGYFKKIPRIRKLMIIDSSGKSKVLVLRRR